jgi:hypothetical protein
MSDIFKLIYLDQTNNKNMTVFLGDDGDVDINEMFIKDKENVLFQGIFSKDQLDTIVKDNFKVTFSKQKIYIDDTIETIKKKIIIAFNEENNVKHSNERLSDEISFDEIYLFSKQIQNLDNSQTYERLTQNGRLTLTRDVLFQFLANINNLKMDNIPMKDIYSYDDIIDLNLVLKPQLIDIPIGQRFITGENIYRYTINPYKVTNYDKLLTTNAEHLITTTNKDLLLTSGFLLENTIYCCLAGDVFKYIGSKNISQATTSKIYYPFLNNKQITNENDLRNQKYELLSENKKILTKNFKKQVDNISLFHNIYEKRTTDLKYIEQGIQMMEFTINQDIEFNVPLEVIFKLIHSTKQIPLVKYNPSTRQENIYRIYCNKTAKNGKKIPYLSKPTITKLVKTLGQSKRVSYYMEYTEDGKKIPIIIEFDNFANVYIKIDFKETMAISSIEKLVINTVNPVIEVVQKYLKSSGYVMKLFQSFYDKNIEINNIRYYSYISIEKNINVNNLLGCVSSVFNVLVGELKKGIVMRYKRVSNFNEMDSQEAFIVELMNRANVDEDIVKLLMDNFDISENEAQLKIADILNNLQVVQSLNKRRRLKIKNNPGFLTKITQDTFKQNITVEMENIDNIFYMSEIPIYIDSLIRMTQYPETTGVDVFTIDKLCKTHKADDAENVVEIVAPSEKKITENIPVAIIDDKLAVGEPASKVVDRSVNVLDFMFDDDDDDDDDEGIDVELSEGELSEGEDDEGIDVELSEGEDEDDEGIDVELSEGEDEDDEGIDVELSGGTNNENIEGEDKLQKDITGMPIADPNPFFKAMHEKEPTLFLTDSDGKYSAYSRICPWNKRRQPVILTDEEKEKIDREHPGSYEQAMKYGSDPNKQYWYICPRYWDLKNNTSLTEEDVKSGKYGEIIPQKAKKVPKGKNIWEFTDPTYHADNDGNYINLNPGFLKKDVHPDGACVPCCFKTWDKPAQIKRRAECNIDNIRYDKDSELDEDNREDIDEGKGESDLEKIIQKPEVDEYIKGPDKYPLEENRFGYLPYIVQRFINTDNKKCQVSNTNKNLKKKHPCYLRKGVENSKNKSFISCISDIYSEKNDNKILTISDFINDKLIPMLTPDTFITLQNGSLIDEFQSANLSEVELEYDETMKKSQIYLQLKDSNPIHLKKIASAIQNFITYLKSKDSYVDYTYLWDLICQPNELLFDKGVNLVILNLPLDDITSNINVICPTNYYSISKYDPKRDTAIIIQKYEYFEPIYIVIDQSKSNMISLATTKLYTPELVSKVSQLNILTNTIQDIYKSMCKPLLSIPHAYRHKEIRFKRNITLEKSIEILNKYNFTINSLVVNYDDKVIGLNIEKNSMSGFVPCFPSGIIASYELVDLDNEDEQKNLEGTLQFLTMVVDETSGEILCKPVVKILEDKLIVGLLTETNQFIPLIEPEQDNDQIIKYAIDDENFYQVDKTIQTSNKIDTERVKYVNRIKLETELYNAFRNKLRTLLNNFKNKQIRDEIKQISDSKSMVYYLQLDTLIGMIKQIMKDEVVFIQATNNTIKNIEDSLKKSEVILIPKLNLLSKLDNEHIYYSKLADELIRYNRIKQFMFNTKVFLSFSDIKYDLNPDEIILLQSLITGDYFDDLVPDITSKYISFNSYDNVEPNKTQRYDNKYTIPLEMKTGVGMSDANVQPDIDKIEDNVSEVVEKKEFRIYHTCPVEIKNVFAKLKLKFRGGYRDIVFSNESAICTFDVALTILRNIVSMNITSNDVKTVLVKKYEELFQLYPNEIVNMFNYYGYISQSKELANGKLTIENLIFNETYHLTNFDLIIISTVYDIPMTFIAPNTYYENKREYLSMNIKNGKTFIIRTSGVNKYKATIPKYKLLINKAKEGLLEIRELPEESIQNEITTQKNNLITLLQSYNKMTDDVEK